MTPIRAVLDRAVPVLRREGYEPIAVGVPAIQGGLAQPDYVVALVGGKQGSDYEVLYADEEGVTGHWNGDDILHAYGAFVTLLYTGEPDAFDVTRRRLPDDSPTRPPTRRRGRRAGKRRK